MDRTRADRQFNPRQRSIAKGDGIEDHQVAAILVEPIYHHQQVPVALRSLRMTRHELRFLDACVMRAKASPPCV